MPHVPDAVARFLGGKRLAASRDENAHSQR